MKNECNSIKCTYKWFENTVEKTKDYIFTVNNESSETEYYIGKNKNNDIVLLEDNPKNLN